MQNKISNFILVLISLIISLYLLELIIFIYLTKNFSTNFNKFNFDKRSRAEIFYDLKKKNPNVVVAIYPYVFIKEQNQTLFPLSGISNKETILCNENGYYAIYNSDRYGFNNPDNVWDSSEIDFLIIGDSFAQGMCVNETDNFSGNLKKLTKKNVINLGMSGNGPIRELASIREYMPIINPKKILWFYYEGNDLSDIDDEMKNEILYKYYTDTTFIQDLKNKQINIDKKMFDKMHQKMGEDYETRKVMNYSYYLRFIKLYTLRNYFKSILLNKKNEINDIKKVSELKKILLSTKKFLEEESDAELYFIYLPAHARYSNLSKINDKNLFLYDEVIKMIRELNINLIDVNKGVLKKSKSPLSFFPFGMSGHYSVYGYKTISEFIVNNINQ